MDVFRQSLEHLYQMLLATPPFTLHDGAEVAVTRYIPPEVGNDGEMTCGVDVKLPGGHLEFTVRNTGWGKSFADEIAKERTKKGKPGHQR